MTKEEINTKKSLLEDSMRHLDKMKENLEELNFNFACFADHFRRSVETQKKENETKK